VSRAQNPYRYPVSAANNFLACAASNAANFDFTRE